MIRKLTAEDVTFTIEVLDEHMPVRGNALASGDDAADRECEDEIIRRINQGDVWAWCCVRVVASWRSWKGDDYLGGCSYEDEEGYRKGGYFDDMKERALDDLNASIARVADDLDSLVTDDESAWAYCGERGCFIPVHVSEQPYCETHRKAHHE